MYVFVANRIPVEDQQPLCGRDNSGDPMWYVFVILKLQARLVELQLEASLELHSETKTTWITVFKVQHFDRHSTIFIRLLFWFFCFYFFYFFGEWHIASVFLKLNS